MKIDLSTITPKTDSKAVGQRMDAPPAASPVRAPAPAPTESAQVALSSASRKMAELQDGDSDIDTEAVTRLRTAIENGEYKIDVSKIADGLIASARDLLK